MGQELYELPEGWEWKSLTDVTRIGAERGFMPEIDNGKAPFIGMSNIDQDTGLDSGYELRDFEIVRKGYTKFQKNAVLLAKITPCTENNKTALIQDINGGYATTEVYPIHPFPETYPHYLLQFLRSPSVREFLVSKMEGATGRQRVPTDAVSSLKIPLPPLNEQKRIVAKLDALFTRIDTAITHLQQTLELSKSLFASALDEIFSPEKNQGTLVSLNQVATVARGKSKHRPRNDKTLFGGNYPFIQTGDVRNAEKYITTYSKAYSEKGLAQSKLWAKGTICLTIAANIGDVAMLGIDACFPDSVVGISSDSESNEYIYYFLTTLQRHLDSKATMAAQKNINLRILSDIEIPLPPLDEQKRIVAHLDALSERTRTLENTTQEKINDLTTLKASLLDTAFKGRL